MTHYDYDTPIELLFAVSRALAEAACYSTATVLLRHRWDGGFWTESFENAGDNAAALSLASFSWDVGQ